MFPISGNSFDYSWRTGGHIVDETFKYISRDVEDRCVVECMRARQALQNILKSDDKSRNPLIAIPGSPGIGKSTFLCHFPESDAYKEYIGFNRHPIVSILTFNKGMTHSPNNQDALGLRVLYGAAVAMGLICRNDINFEDFTVMFPHYNLHPKLGSVYASGGVWSRTTVTFASRRNQQGQKRQSVYERTGRSS